jgi:hypothetical protein
MLVPIIIHNLTGVPDLIDYGWVHIIEATALAIQSLRLSILETSSNSHESTRHVHIRRSHCWSIINSFFKLSVSLFLNGLSVLQLLNKFHLKHFHLHHLCFFLSDQLFLFSDLFRNFFSRSVEFLFSEFFNFCSLNSFLLFLNSIFHFFFLFFLHNDLIMTIFLLFSNEFSLFSFLFFV